MWGNTPVLVAAQYSQPDILRFLIESGADVTISNDSGATALLYTCMEGQTELVPLLLSKGAVVEPVPARVYNSKTDCHTRLTPLLAAATNGHVEVVRLLLAAGADCNRAVAPALTTMGLNEQDSCSDVPPPSDSIGPPSSTTMSSEANGTTPLLAASAGGHTETVKVLVEHGADLASTDGWGNTALLLAVATAKSSECSQAILSSLAQHPPPHVIINQPSRMLLTPLHAACENGMLDTALELIKMGADLEAKTRIGETSLMKACQKGDGNLDVVRALINHGADVLSRDNRGKTALDVAQRSK